MQKGLLGGLTTLLFSTGIILVVILIGLVTFGVAAELEKSRPSSDLSVADAFDPNMLAAPAAGFSRHDPGNTLDCEGVIFRAATNGIRYVRESGAGQYYAAEVHHVFGIYTLYYGHLVKIENSSLDIHTFRKLKHALYRCDEAFTRSGLRIALGAPDDIRS